MERKEGNVFLTTHSTHFIYGYMASDSERGNSLPPHGLLFPISSKGSFICIIHDRITAFVTPFVEHRLKRKIAQWVHHEGSIRRSIAPFIYLFLKRKIPSCSQTKPGLKQLTNQDVKKASLVIINNDSRNNEPCRNLDNGRGAKVGLHVI